MKNIFLPIIARRWRELVARANLPVQIAPHYSHYSHYFHYSHPKFAHFVIKYYFCPTISKFAN